MPKDPKEGEANMSIQTSEHSDSTSQERDETDASLDVHSGCESEPTSESESRPSSCSSSTIRRKRKKTTRHVSSILRPKGASSDNSAPTVQLVSVNLNPSDGSV